MRRFLVLCLFLVPVSVLAQTQAPLELRTPDGRTVVLKADGTWEYKKELVPTPTSRPVNSNTSLGTLSPNYSGHDPKTLLVQLTDLKRRLVKSEFETTADYVKRVAEEKKKPILNDLTIQNTFYLVVSGVVAEYDADSQTMRFFLPVEKNALAETYRLLYRSESKSEIRDLSRINLYSISLGGYDDPVVFFDDVSDLTLTKKDYRQGFSVSVNVAVEEAKRLKNTTKAVLSVRFEEPYIVERYRTDAQFQARLIDVHFFDQQTGKTLGKIGTTASPVLTPAPVPEKSKLLKRAIELYNLGHDQEALTELRRLVMEEPTNAEGYLLSARINWRNGDKDATIAAAKTAVFWDPELIEAHILLAKVFLANGDRTEANKYIINALNIDPTNQEAITLRRQTLN
jgi:tetratricopeptide (TPR) repeat protein